MKKIILTHLFIAILAGLYAQQALNVDLFAQFHRGDERYSGSWYYVGPDGSEYALLGAKTGTAIYSIDDAENIEELAFIPGPSSNWREIIVVADHAYVSTEANSAETGMQVIDLSDLPNGASLVTTYTETFTRGHIIQKDIFSEAPFVYVIGTTATSGIHILDVSDPANPVEVGLYAPTYYIHECHVRGDILFAAAFNQGTIDIVDISDKGNPALLARFSTPGGRTHSASMSMDGKYLFVAPEQDGLKASIWNIEDFEDPFQVASYTANLESLVHNPYVLGDFAFISHNTEGLRVVDFSDPTLPVEVGFYDTFEGPSGGFAGLWSACPYLPSGKIIGGNREDGLYVWTFNGTRAARAYGLVRDSLTQAPIVNAEIVVAPSGAELNSDLEGRFKYGDFAGTYTFTVSAENYLSKTVTIDIAEGGQEDLTVDLVQDEINSIDESFQNGINIFPNPFTDVLQIQFNDLAFAGNISLLNSLGLTLRSFRVNHHDLHINRSQLSAGVYYLKFTDTTGKMLGRKVVVIQ